MKRLMFRITWMRPLSRNVLHTMSNYIPWVYLLLMWPFLAWFICILLMGSHLIIACFCMFFLILLLLCYRVFVITILYIRILNGVFVSVNPNTAVILFHFCHFRDACMTLFVSERIRLSFWFFSGQNEIAILLKSLDFVHMISFILAFWFNQFSDKNY